MAEPHGELLKGWIQSDDGPIQLRPVTVSKLSALEMLLSLGRVEENPDFATTLAQKALDLHQRGDVPGLKGIDFNNLDLSLAELMGEGGVLEQINRFQPSDEVQGERDEFPPWASGDLVSDLVTDLTHSLGDFEQAWSVVNRLSLQDCSNFLRRLSDLRKGPEQREKDGLKSWFWRNATQFTDDFYGAG